jgi:tetratricopeptide (TPR) repeat protein
MTEELLLALASRQDYDRAIELVQTRLLSGDAPLFWRLQKALLYFLDRLHAERYYNAPQELESFLMDYPRSANAHFWLGYLNLIIRLDEARAREELYKCLAIDPTHAYAHIALAGGLVKASYEALRHLDRALEFQPCNYRALEEKADLLLSQGDTVAASDIFQVLLNCAPFVERNYGIMNDYLNGVFTAALRAEQIRERCQRKLAGLT